MLCFHRYQNHIFQMKIIYGGSTNYRSVISCKSKIRNNIKWTVLNGTLFDLRLKLSNCMIFEVRFCLPDRIHRLSGCHKPKTILGKHRISSRVLLQAGGYIFPDKLKRILSLIFTLGHIEVTFSRTKNVNSPRAKLKMSNCVSKNDKS